MQATMSERWIYYLARKGEFEQAREGAFYLGSSEDRADGFIHFSTAGQAPNGRPRSPAGRNRCRAARPGLALGGGARRPAVSASLRQAAAGGGTAQRGPAARRRRAFLSRLGVILSAVAGLIAYAAV